MIPLKNHFFSSHVNILAFDYHKKLFLKAFNYSKVYQEANKTEISPKIHRKFEISGPFGTSKYFHHHRINSATEFENTPKFMFRICFHSLNRT